MNFIDKSFSPLIATFVCQYSECIDHPTIEGDYKLECTIDPYCKCPNYTARCEDDCYNATLIVEFDSAGVDPACYPNDTCEPQDCTSEYISTIQY